MFMKEKDVYGLKLLLYICNVSYVLFFSMYRALGMWLMLHRPIHPPVSSSSLSIVATSFVNTLILIVRAND